MKSRIYEIIEKAEEGDRLSRVFDNTILTLILLTIIAIVLESYQEIDRLYSSGFRIFELISIIVFSIEYILRVWTSDLKYENMHPIKARLKYMCSFMALVDLLAILPFYLPFLLPFDLRFLRILRLTRLLRVMKLNRYSKAMNLIVKVVRNKKEELISTITIMIFIILISSTLIYYMENEVQPDMFPNIVASFWWAVATLTTVGYGDIYPITVAGKIFASIIAITGIGLVALPTGILSSGFISEIQNNNDSICPHCGEKIEKD